MEKGGSHVLLRNLYSRIVPVVDTDAGQFRSGGCQSLSVLVEHDVSLGLDELKRKGQRFGLVGMKAYRVVGRPNCSGRRDRHETHLALFINPIHLTPSRILPLQLDTRFPQFHPQRICSFPGMVVRDLAMNVMRYMGLRDSMGESSCQPSHHRTQIPQKAPIVRRQRASREGELVRTVVWEEGIGVLEEGDQDDPVVDPTRRGGA